MNLLCNDEGFYYNHWIPDGADDDELLDIAKYDEDTYSDAVRCFINQFHKAACTLAESAGRIEYPQHISKRLKHFS